MIKRQCYRCGKTFSKNTATSADKALNMHITAMHTNIFKEGRLKAKKMPKSTALVPANETTPTNGAIQIIAKPKSKPKSPPKIIQGEIIEITRERDLLKDLLRRCMAELNL